MKHEVMLVVLFDILYIAQIMFEMYDGEWKPWITLLFVSFRFIIAAAPPDLLLLLSNSSKIKYIQCINVFDFKFIWNDENIYHNLWNIAVGMCWDAAGCSSPGEVNLLQESFLCTLNFLYNFSSQNNNGIKVFHC